VTIKTAPDPVEWLRAQLGGRAPRLQRRIVHRAARAGISRTALQAAALTLGVEIVGAGSQLAFWRLPN
jgi:hypothetical protein